MPNKKAAFLFGAGAVLDWGGPFTRCKREKLTCLPEHGSDEIKNRVCCFTHLITDTGFCGKDGERITNKILKALDSKAANSVANFETIINVIEDLYTYWSVKNSKDPINLHSLANLDHSIAEFSFFKHSIPNTSTRKYSISIPIPGYPDFKKDFIPETIPPILKYYEIFLNELLAGIKGHISKYSYHTSGHDVIFKQCNELINKQFYQWMQRFVEEDYTLRMYTLNYDRMFKVLLQNSGLDVFEGFELNGTAVDFNQKIPPNLPRIISDSNSHIHYNLHGSVHWGIETHNGNNLPGYQYFLSPFVEIDNPTATIEIERGKQLLLTNLITGYQKVQRTAISPFRQMFSAFDKDCFEADRLYIVGYSFGDEHVNDIIRNARKFNNKLEIVLIDPKFDENKFALDFISHWGSSLNNLYQNGALNEIISPEFKVRIIKKEFGIFLKEQK